MIYYCSKTTEKESWRANSKNGHYTAFLKFTLFQVFQAELTYTDCENDFLKIWVYFWFNNHEKLLFSNQWVYL